MSSTKAHAGDLVFRGENPPVGAIIDLWARDGVPDGTTVTIHAASGVEVARVPVPARRNGGVVRVVWNLRHPDLRSGRGAGDDDDPFGGGLPGRWATPGSYEARVTLGGTSYARRFEVREDSRVRLAPLARQQWTEALDRIALLYRDAAALADSTRGEVKRLEGTTPRDERRLTEARDLAETAAELVQRIAALYGNTVRVSEPPTTDQRSQQQYFPTVLKTLRQRWAALGTRS